MTEAYNEYAEALFILARENGLEKDFFDALSDIDSVFGENSEYLDFLSSPAIPKDERIAALDAAFEASIHEYVLSFLKLLCERGRIKDFYACREEYEKLYKAAFGIVTAKITSAYPLSEDEKKQLIDKLRKISGSTVVPEYFTDPSLLGGVVVEINGKLLDGSLKTRLKEVSQSIQTLGK